MFVTELVSLPLPVLLAYGAIIGVGLGIIANWELVSLNR